MKRPNYPILALAAAAILLISVVAFKRYLPYTGSNLAPKEPPAIVLAMEDVRLVGFADRGKVWSAKARKVEIAQNRATTTLTGITHGRIYDEGKAALEIEAGRAVYDVHYRNLELDGGIVVRDMNGQTIRCPGASWNPAMAVLRSNGQVTFDADWSRLTAESMLLDVRKREMSMWKVGMVLDLKEVERHAQ